MKVYLAGSMAGGRAFAGSLREINDLLINLGHNVLTPFVVDEKINQIRFPKLKGVNRARAIFKQDLELVTKADVIIAEVSQPSIGVGIELGFAAGLIRLAGKAKPILLLRHRSLENERNSNLVLGNPYATFLYYDKESIEGVITNFFQKIKKKI